MLTIDVLTVLLLVYVGYGTGFVARWRYPAACVSFLVTIPLATLVVVCAMVYLYGNEPIYLLTATLWVALGGALHAALHGGPKCNTR